MSKKKELLSSDFFYMLVIFIFMSIGIAYLFYSLGYSHALETMGLEKIQRIQSVSYSVERDSAL